MHKRRTEPDQTACSEGDHSTELYGIATQIMLFLEAMDADYLKTGEKEYEK